MARTRFASVYKQIYGQSKGEWHESNRMTQNRPKYKLNDRSNDKSRDRPNDMTRQWQDNDSKWQLGAKMTIRMSIVVACMVVQANANDTSKGNQMTKMTWFLRHGFLRTHSSPTMPYKDRHIFRFHWSGLDFHRRKWQKKDKRTEQNDNFTISLTDKRTPEIDDNKDNKDIIRQDIKLHLWFVVKWWLNDTD